MLMGLAGLTLTGCTPLTPASTVTVPVPSASVSGPHAWLEEEAALAQGFCFTWLRGLAPGEVARRMGARTLGDYAWQAGPDLSPDDASPGDGLLGDDEAELWITKSGDWALMVEFNGITGIEDDLLRHLSIGTRVISNYRNVEMDGRFVLVDNTTIEVDFDPATPDNPAGTQPALLAPQMRDLGLTGDPQGPYTEAALTLTARLTGIPFTAELLRDSTYLVAAIPDPLQ